MYAAECLLLLLHIQDFRRTISKGRFYKKSRFEASFLLALDQMLAYTALPTGEN
jgi:hypothetical protein